MEVESMKKLFIPLLALIVLCLCATALAEGEATVALELRKEKLPVYAEDDPYAGLFSLQNGDQDPALSTDIFIIPVKKSYGMAVTVTPKNLKNKKVDFTVADEEIAKIKGNSITGLKPGETVLTIASNEDPSVFIRYRVIVFQPVTKLTAVSSAKSVNIGETVQLTASYAPENATVQKVTWKSLDERIAVVDENGVVTGVKRGNIRLVATAADGSKLRANISLKVTQKAEEITLNKTEITVDIGKNAVLKPTVLPKNTDNKGVEWTSSDESIAKVNNQGRVTGVSTGECEVICTSKSDAAVQSRATVHVQIPVKSIKLGEPPMVYAGESAKLSWTVEPADATNQAISLKAGNEKVLQVSNDGTLTGIKIGESYVNAATTDGSNRKARIKVIVRRHLTDVRMKRRTAYIDVKRTDSLGAIFTPDKYINRNMTWETADESVATVKGDPKNPGRVKITGVAKGETTVTGTTEDGGLKTTFGVRIGNWSKALQIRKATINGKGNLLITVRNASDSLLVNSVTLEIEAYDGKGKPVAINTKDGSNTVQATCNVKIGPGKTTPDNKWKLINYNKDIGFQQMTVRIVKYQIDNDWIMVINKRDQPTYKYKP